MQEVQTFRRFVVPFMTTRMVCRFGRNRLFVIPVIFFPTPPFFFAIPRLAIVLPATGLFPQIAHTRDMSLLLFVEIRMIT